MVFILVDSGDPARDFILSNAEWRGIVEVIRSAKILPYSVAETLGDHLCTPISYSDTHKIAALIGSQSEPKFLSGRLTRDELDRLVAFLQNSRGIEVC